MSRNLLPFQIEQPTTVVEVGWFTTSPAHMVPTMSQRPAGTFRLTSCLSVLLRLIGPLALADKIAGALPAGAPIAGVSIVVITAASIAAMPTASASRLTLLVVFAVIESPPYGACATRR